MEGLTKEQELILRVQLRYQLQNHILIEQGAGLDTTATKKDWTENELAIKKLKEPEKEIE